MRRVIALGAAVAADVPQLTAAQAAQYTVASYLGGWWPPGLAGRPSR
jgi:hypothetical protein